MKRKEKKQDKTGLKGFAVGRSPVSKNQSFNKNHLSNGASLLDIFFPPSVLVPSGNKQIQVSYHTTKIISS